jgi:hypothetical protein
MRIIKAAKQMEEHITTCRHCKSMLGIKATDLEWGCGCWVYNCSVCGDTNEIQEDKNSLFPWKMEDEYDRRLQGDNPVRIN